MNLFQLYIRSSYEGGHFVSIIGNINKMSLLTNGFFPQIVRRISCSLGVLIKSELTPVIKFAQNTAVPLN